MSLRRHLRQRDRRQLALEMMCNRHPGSVITTFITEDRYLQLLLQNESGSQAQVWLDIDRWLSAMDAHLPDIPWRDVPLNYLVRWLDHLELSFWFEGSVWNAVQVASSEVPVNEKAVLLPADPCPLLCVDWPEEGIDLHEGGGIGLNKVPFQLQYVLGSSQLTLGMLVGVTAGDLLLIKNEFAHLVVGRRRLYKLNYQREQEVIVEEQLVNNNNENCEEECLYEWTSLPVEIEFVLDGRTVTLAELEVIKPGTALALNPDAEKNVKVYLNKKIFARGELVALENGSLAVEVNHVNPALIESTE